MANETSLYDQILDGLYLRLGNGGFEPARTEALKKLLADNPNPSDELVRELLEHEEFPDAHPQPRGQ